MLQVVVDNQKFNPHGCDGLHEGADICPQGQWVEGS